VSRVLVVDDDLRILKTLEVNLRARGFEAVLARSGEEALQLAARHHPDVVVLDLGLPGMDGLDVVRGLRGWTSVPIVVLSGRGTEAAKVEALDLGADDYLTKPFGMDELFARLRASLRRAVVPEGEPVVATPDFTIDFAAKQVRRDGELVRLTPTQWHIVEVLVRNAGRLVTYEQLLQEVWGPGYGKETNYLRVFMTQIRQKLEPDHSRPRYFVTEPGIGFRFEPGAAGPTSA
jgi:two-component system KDP operon response regulator KdpE